MAKKNCNHCGKYKDEEEFNWRFKSLGVRHKTCRECIHKFNKAYFEGPAKKRHLQQVKERKQTAREVARQFVWDYLASHPCQGTLDEGSPCCESNPIVLEFHHIRGTKEMDVSAMVASGYPVAKIQAEIDKCIVLCANCHRKITHKERGWFLGRK
ncbi:MAG TPA: hypothetical protein VK900_13010 [Anaerolineales bacterium]|nr:hypothetical protein [Anaerolineales bacterium]